MNLGIVSISFYLKGTRARLMMRDGYVLFFRRAKKQTWRMVGLAANSDLVNI